MHIKERSRCFIDTICLAVVALLIRDPTLSGKGVALLECYKVG